MRLRYDVLTFICLLSWIAAGGAGAQSQVTLNPSMDNTLYQESGSKSNGAGSYLFVGRTRGTAGTESRRALIAFDVASSIPAGSTVDNVELDLKVSKSPGGSTVFSIHRLTRSWGEGSSDAGAPGGQGTQAESGDATWTHAFFDTENWATAGGDYADDASATVSVGGDEWYAASSDGLVADVQAWVDDPEANFGWIFVGDELTSGSARRVDSGDNPDESVRPQLTVSYSTPTAAEQSEQPEHPGTFVLEGNYPNPFTSSTAIRYELGTAQEVGLEVYDVTGRPVKTVRRGVQVPGRHEMELPSVDLAAGLYIYCLRTSSHRECRTFTVLR
ncbi:MAG: DNRLRE domain-containing protein [Rhodothermales bacterium]